MAPQRSVESGARSTVALLVQAALSVPRAARSGAPPATAAAEDPLARVEQEGVAEEDLRDRRATPRPRRMEAHRRNPEVQHQRRLSAGRRDGLVGQRDATARATPRGAVATAAGLTDAPGARGGSLSTGQKPGASPGGSGGGATSAPSRKPSRSAQGGRSTSGGSAGTAPSASPKRSKPLKPTRSPVGPATRAAPRPRRRRPVAES